jgi:hypothetical protein
MLRISKNVAEETARRFWDEGIPLADNPIKTYDRLKIDDYGLLLVNTENFSDAMPKLIVIERFMAGGIMCKQPTQTRIMAKNIPVKIYEAELEKIETMMKNILESRSSKFQCTLYKGTPESYVWAKKYVNCFFTSNPITQGKEIIVNMTVDFSEHLPGNKKG